MHIVDKLEDYQYSGHPLVLTIGNFDGMHRGHHAVLRQAKELAGSEGKPTVLTFRNHPSEVLRPEHSVPLLSTLSHKLLLLEKADIDTVILLPFTRYLAQHSAQSFIENIRTFIPFSHLVLGHDATLGRDRQGNRQTMQELGMKWGFHVHYIEEYRYEGKPVSSTHIRETIQKGDLNEAEELLNRPYSIYAPVITGEGKGKLLGFPTANLDVAGLCLPPFGVYAVDIIDQSRRLQGIANLGIAPTVKENASPLLEVHLFDNDENWVGRNIEVIFKKFLRPEQKFQSTDQLRKQIQQDIASLKFCRF